MSAIEQLTKADEALAARIDTLTAAVQMVGTRTHAAKARLEEALHQARTFLLDTSAELADAFGLTLEAFGHLDGCEMLSVPSPEPDHVVEAPPAPLAEPHGSPVVGPATTEPPPAPAEEETVDLAEIGRLHEEAAAEARAEALAPLTVEQQHRLVVAMRAAEIGAPPSPNGRPRRKGRR